MALSTVYLAPAVVVSLLVYQYIILPAFISPLARIPAANWIAKISDFWILYIRWRDIENQTVLALHAKLGPIVRLGPNELSVNNYDGGLKVIYQGGFPKHDFYANKFLWFGTPNMFTMSNNRQHSERKRLISHIYSKSNVYVDPVIQSTASNIIHERLMPVLLDSATNNEPIEVMRLCWSYSMDRFTAFQYGLSQASNFLQDTKQRDWFINGFHSGKPYTFWTDCCPRLTHFLSKVGINLIPSRVFEAQSQMEDWILRKCDKVEEMLSSGAKIPDQDRPALYTHLRMTMNKASPQPANTSPQSYPYRLDLASEMFDHSVAAIETSGNTLTWLLYEMSRHPNLQQALREELLTLESSLLYISGGGEGEAGKTLLPPFSQLDSLPLLQAILQETLRAWPVLPGGQPRITPPSCPPLAGYPNIPAGVKVHSAAGVLHRNADVFPAPETWDPRRWLDASEDQLREMGHYMWAFSSGGRMCIGSNFAVNSMKLMIAAIYTNFTTSIVDEEGIEMSEGFISGPKGGKLILQFHKV